MKNKTADNMFFELGFEKILKNNKIIYRIKHGILIPDTEIIFDCKNKWISTNFISLDIKELYAINKKIEELRWNE